jgi:hypothetical protein
MWATAVAIAVWGSGIVPRPPTASRGQLRAALARPVARAAPQPARKVEAPHEEPGTLARALNGVALNGPVVLKPEFQGGPGAAIELKF